MEEPCKEYTALAAPDGKEQFVQVDTHDWVETLNDGVKSVLTCQRCKKESVGYLTI